MQCYQQPLDVITEDVIPINNRAAYQVFQNHYYYFYGLLPIFQHHVDDRDTFRMFLAQMVVSGIATQAELIRSFKVSKSSMIRWVKKLREKGPRGFYEPRRGRGPTVIVGHLKDEIQEMLDQGCQVSEISERLNVKEATINKAIKQGRLKKNTS